MPEESNARLDRIEAEIQELRASQDVLRADLDRATNVSASGKIDFQAGKLHVIGSGQWITTIVVAITVAALLVDGTALTRLLAWIVSVSK